MNGNFIVLAPVLVVFLSLLPEKGDLLPVSERAAAEIYCANHNMEAVCICDRVNFRTELLQTEETSLTENIFSIERSLEEGVARRRDLNLCEFVEEESCGSQKMICLEKEDWNTYNEAL